jgi:hypothetical protein
MVPMIPQAITLTSPAASVVPFDWSFGVSLILLILLVAPLTILAVGATATRDPSSRSAKAGLRVAVVFPRFLDSSRR